MKKILFIFGTRPEAIKLCPLYQRLKLFPEIYSVKVCVTAQHRDMLDQVLEAFQVTPDVDLNLMTPNRTLGQSTARILSSLEPILQKEKPDMVLVQGDTTTTLCGSLAAFYRRIPVGHVEAGLRTGDLCQPFPEEMNRVVVTRLAQFHFAATHWAAGNLRKEGMDPKRIFVTGNTGIDAVLQVAARLERGELKGEAWPQLDPERKLILVTAHRRESFGEGFDRICSALLKLSRRPDVQILYPVHPNPSVHSRVYAYLASQENVILINPLGYVPFVDLMQRATLLLTDSGGVQEEGPSLGKPILVLRQKTERPEAVETGTVKLVGTDSEKIVFECNRLLDSPQAYQSMAKVHNPYGDGHACEKIESILRQHWGI